MRIEEVVLVWLEIIENERAIVERLQEAATRTEFTPLEIVVLIIFDEKKICVCVIDGLVKRIKDNSDLCIYKRINKGTKQIVEDKNPKNNEKLTNKN